MFCEQYGEQSLHHSGIVALHIAEVGPHFPLCHTDAGQWTNMAIYRFVKSNPFKCDSEPRWQFVQFDSGRQGQAKLPLASSGDCHVVLGADPVECIS